MVFFTLVTPPETSPTLYSTTPDESPTLCSDFKFFRETPYLSILTKGVISSSLLVIHSKILLLTFPGTTVTWFILSVSWPKIVQNLVKTYTTETRLSKVYECLEVFNSPTGLNPHHKDQEEELVKLENEWSPCLSRGPRRTPKTVANGQYP